MKAWELVLAALLYFNVARRYGMNGDIAEAVAWFAYAVANIAFFTRPMGKV